MSETYDSPERLLLSGAEGVIASYVRSIYRTHRENVWSLGEIELLALARPIHKPGEQAVLFEIGGDQPGRITLYRLLSISGVSQPDSTEMVAHFQTLVSNYAPDDLAAFRQRFIIPQGRPRADLYETLKLSGGTQSGNWKWAEMENILNATVISGSPAPASR